MDFVAAATFIAEIGDLSRFAHPKALMNYLGLILSEHSSGNSRRLRAPEELTHRPTLT